MPIAIAVAILVRDGRAHGLAWFTADEIGHLTLADPSGRALLQAAARSSTT